MPVHRCGSSALCLHEFGGGQDADEVEDLEYVEIDPSGRYGRYKEVLGRGAFKTVYRAFDQEDGIEVAWNQVQDVLLRTQDDLDRLYSEVHLLSQLKHKNIMKLYHSWVDKKARTVNFITEIFTSGTLRQYRKRHKHIDIKAAKNWSRQILRGLLYLHSHDPPIIHRDLKCDNIFINGNHGEVKIGDLGLAAILQHAHARSVIGTPEFMAPELYEEEYTELVDIYSFGMCLLEMVTSQYPYSECSNAAQIYKKVMLGKRPEALKLVKDQELCQFIEKCLAPASKRLPARELLRDSFLQCEASQSSLDSSPLVGRVVRRAIGMDDPGVINEEPHAISATVQISYVLKETLPAFMQDGAEVCGCVAADLKGAQSGDIKAPQAAELTSSHLKEDRARSVDFRVNGKRREDNTVFLKLRISGSEGQVRNIHFPFDVQGDTAMCVASEMVAELDLTDQDVTKIAEMIDAAILALVPEWKPGVAIDETYCEGETPDIEGGDGSASVLDPKSLTEGLLEDMVPPPMTEMLSPRVEGLVYGRFEEVTYQCHRSEFPPLELEQNTEQCTITSDTSDSVKEAEWSLSDSSSSHNSQMLVSTSEAGIPLYNNSRESKDSSDVGTAFNELVELNRKSGCANFVHKILEGLVHGHSCGETDTELASALPPVNDADAAAADDEDCCDDETERELAELALRHAQEKLELQRKHEEALAEVRRRCHQRRRTNCKDRDDGCHSEDGNALSTFHKFSKTHVASVEMKRNSLGQYGSFNGSMTSLEDFSSVGQQTPRSTSNTVGLWQEAKSERDF